MTEAQLRTGTHSRLLEQFLKVAGQGGQIVGMNIREDVVPDECGGIITEDALNGGAFVADGSVGLDDADYIGGILHEGAEVILSTLPIRNIQRDADQANGAPTGIPIWSFGRQIDARFAVAGSGFFVGLRSA